MQEEYIGRTVKNLPVLRVAVGLTQEQLGAKLGVSRQTVVAIENGKSPLTWSMYLAMLYVFQQYEEAIPLLTSLNLINSEFIKKI